MSSEREDRTDLFAKDLIATGAAADSVALDDTLKALPRLLRYAVLSNRYAEAIGPRLLADISEIAPGLSAAVSWAADPSGRAGLALAAELDHLAVGMDKPELRSLADCVRLLSLPVPVNDRGDHRRLTKSLLLAFRQLPTDIDLELAAEIETIVFGWAALSAVEAPLLNIQRPAGEAAASIGQEMAHWRVKAAIAETRVALSNTHWPNEATENSRGEIAEDDLGLGRSPLRADHIIVCRMPAGGAIDRKLRELVTPLRHVIGVGLALNPVPPLQHVRNALLFEFPYAEAAIDFALADLVGRTTVRLRPLLLVGDAGAGKSRFVRRLAEVLNVGIWRTDASRSDGATFAGTDKRWYSAEPCHPFLAIAQAKHANPVVQIDEIEKAGTRSDYGRFWDCLLGFLEPETAVSYPDPALQISLDLSHVSYIATANSLEALPSPLRDRFRVVVFPKPGVDHLNALLAPVIADLAAERGLDRRWIEPLAGYERDLVASHWAGGSIRRLRRVVEAVLQSRESALPPN